jgi:hypothetical protein
MIADGIGVGEVLEPSPRPQCPEPGSLRAVRRDGDPPGCFFPRIVTLPGSAPWMARAAVMVNRARVNQPLRAVPGEPLMP